MKKIIIYFSIFVVVVILLVAGFVYLSQSEKITPATGEPDNANEDSSKDEKVSEHQTTLGYKYYRNEEWGFAFEYPEDWEVHENFSKSYYSKFNLMISPVIGLVNETPISLNVTTPEFVTSSFAPYQGQKTITTLKDKKVDLYNYGWQEIGKTSLILPFGDYSLILGSNEYYEAEFTNFLDSFEFLK